MKIRIVSLIVLGFLIGCKHESIITPTVPADGSGGNALNPGLVGGYLPDIGVPDPIISLSMTLDGNLKFDSSLLCNDQDASHFQISQKIMSFVRSTGVQSQHLPLPLTLIKMAVTLILKFYL